MSELEYQHVTGLWSHVVFDGILDGDTKPDEVFPTGKVMFSPRVGTQGFLPSGSPAVSTTVADVTALVAAGVLTDLNGNAGVDLVAKIGDHDVWWTANPTLLWGKQRLAAKAITFAPSAGATIHLNDLIDPGEIPQDDWPSFLDAAAAQAALADAQAAAASAEAAAAAIPDDAIGKAEADATYAPVDRALPAGGATGQIPVKTADGVAWQAPPSGGSGNIAITDNANGTVSLTATGGSSTVTDNGNGTATIAA